MLNYCNTFIHSSIWVNVFLFASVELSQLVIFHLKSVLCVWAFVVPSVCSHSEGNPPRMAARTFPGRRSEGLRRKQEVETSHYPSWCFSSQQLRSCFHYVVSFCPSFVQTIKQCSVCQGRTNRTLHRQKTNKEIEIKRWNWGQWNGNLHAISHLKQHPGEELVRHVSHSWYTIYKPLTQTCKEGGNSNSCPSCSSVKRNLRRGYGKKYCSACYVTRGSYSPHQAHNFIKT